MTKEEKSLLLYFETRCVDQRGSVHLKHMNEDDMRIAKKWSDSVFVKFGRIASDCLPLPSGATHWCELSDEAWGVVHAERIERYKRSIAKRTWYTTEEKKAARAAEPEEVA